MLGNFLTIKGETYGNTTIDLPKDIENTKDEKYMPGSYEENENKKNIIVKIRRRHLKLLGYSD